MNHRAGLNLLPSGPDQRLAIPFSQEAPPAIGDSVRRKMHVTWSGQEPLILPR